MKNKNKWLCLAENAWPHYKEKMQIKSVFEIQFYSAVLQRLKSVIHLTDKYTGSRQPSLCWEQCWSGVSSMGSGLALSIKILNYMFVDSLITSYSH